LSSESFFRQKATAAADSTPMEAALARLDAPPPAPWLPPPPPPLLSSQNWLLWRPLLASAAHEPRRFSRLDSHLGAMWWYCTEGFTGMAAALSSAARMPRLETREVDTMGLRLTSAGVSRAPRHALVWSTRLHGDRLRDLRAISLVGTDDNMAAADSRDAREAKL